MNEGADTKDEKKEGTSNPADTSPADAIDADDPHKVEKLAKSGHDDDTTEGSE